MSAPESSSLKRLLKLSSTAGRVGASMAGNVIAEIARPEEGRDERKAQHLVRNALRIVETLGELKGAAMKVGQMISLHDGLLPEEVAAVFRRLQKEAPQVPFEVMRYEIEGALDRPAEEIFVELEPEPIGSASIGQVYRGRLAEGRTVAVKVQYPLIQEIIQADLDNLRRAFKALFSLFTSADFDPIWEEVRAHLLEEIDYVREAEHLRSFGAEYADHEEILVPGVIEDATSSRVLTMEYLPGFSADLACSGAFEQPQKDGWGEILFRFVTRGLFETRTLHADPNMGNYGFRADGRVAIYDFGCVKEVPSFISAGYARVVLAAMEGRFTDVPEHLRRMGFCREDGSAIALELMMPYLELVADLLGDDPPYSFGEDAEFYQRLIDHGLSHWHEGVGMRFPEHAVFIDRALGGTLGNLRRLGATARWGEIVRPYLLAAANESG